MNSKLAKLALTATLALATTLTLNACEEKKKQDGADTKPPEAVAEAATQEAVVAEPKAAEVVKGSFTDTRDKKTYKTVKIGEQVWMAENLNYEAKDSKCYDNKPDNCQKYGRLYDWETAKKACPSGWHLPSDEEWEVLENFAGGLGYLKATNGWDEDTGGYGNDKFGFSALPGGRYGYFDPEAGGDLDFLSVGNFGGWWSSTGNDDFNVAKIKYMGLNFEDVDGGYFHKSRMYSVRCIKD
jgi:uncharacterized protein (TIGR02145 family)